MSKADRYNVLYFLGTKWVLFTDGGDANYLSHTRCVRIMNHESNHKYHPEILPHYGATVQRNTRNRLGITPTKTKT